MLALTMLARSARFRDPSSGRRLISSRLSCSLVELVTAAFRAVIGPTPRILGVFGVDGS